MIDQRPISKDEFTDEHRKNVCRIGQGNNCCRYLTMGPNGWGCEKLTGLAAYLDQRAETETMVAQGDNCGGVIRAEEHQHG